MIEQKKEINKLLKTQCGGCIFSKQETCLLKKEVFEFDGLRYTEGFCRHKRENNWLDIQLNQSLSNLIGEINKEEIGISLIIAALDNNYEKIKATVDSVRNHDIVKQIVIVARKINKDDAEDIIQLLNSKDIKWSFNNIVLDEEPTELEAIDNSVDKAECNWFLSVLAGDTLTISQLDFIKQCLTLNNNLVGGYLPGYHQERAFVNKQAFFQLQGHFEVPWLEKLKIFDNFKSVCIKIN